jgi:hypothetical protein
MYQLKDNDRKLVSGGHGFDEETPPKPIETENVIALIEHLPGGRGDSNSNVGVFFGGLAGVIAFAASPLGGGVARLGSAIVNNQKSNRRTTEAGALTELCRLGNDVACGIIDDTLAQRH